MLSARIQCEQGLVHPTRADGCHDIPRHIMTAAGQPAAVPAGQHLYEDVDGADDARAEVGYSLVHLS